MSEARLQRALKIQREGKKIIRNFCDFWISPQTSHAAAVFVFVRPRSGASWSSSQQSTHNDDKHEPVELKFKDTKSGAEEWDDIFSFLLHFYCHPCCGCWRCLWVPLFCCCLQSVWMGRWDSSGSPLLCFPSCWARLSSTRHQMTSEKRKTQKKLKRKSSNL